MKYNLIGIEDVKPNGYSIIPLRKKDIYLVRKWRNEQIDILRQSKKITKREQLLYYSNVIFPSFSCRDPKILLVSYLKNDECIGYGGLTNIRWKSKCAEVSFVLNTERTKCEKQYTEDFTSFLILLKRLAFDRLLFNRLFTETFDVRPLHISILEKNGFVLEGRMRQHVKIDGKFADSLIHAVLREDFYV